MMTEGDKLPAFTVLDDHGQPVSTADLAHGTVVLYFYPKDDTPGCTKESCAFRDALDAFTERGTRIFGISADDVDSHVRFRDKFGLTFPLLADTKRVLCEAFGVWGEQQWQGHKYQGIARTTFVLRDGVVIKVFPNVDVMGHAERVLAAV
ncbi:MAG: peroxiredoxin [Myxococcales bacterium]|nr:peroxiredoxin [Myxococcales bacterium]